MLVNEKYLYIPQETEVKSTIINFIKNSNKLKKIQFNEIKEKELKEN